MERWLPIPEWEGIYEVSDLGNVRRIIGGTSTYAGRILRQSLNAHGYKLVTLRYQERWARKLTHRLVAAAFIGECPIGMEANHKDGQRANAALANLEYVTNSENKLHSYRVLGRPKVRLTGEKNHKAKVSEQDVREIRKAYAAGGISQQALGLRYGLTQQVVSFLVNRKTWAHVA